MELGLDLNDDSLFESSREDRNKKSKATVCYSVKNCPPFWFMDKGSELSEDMPSLLKYQADLAYREGRIEEALKLFSESQGPLGSGNHASWRALEEDRARCYIRLHRFNEAIDCAKRIGDIAQNHDHTMSVLNLFIDICKSAQQLRDESVHIRQVLLLNPFSPQHWLRLADLFCDEKVCLCRQHVGNDVIKSDLPLDAANGHDPAQTDTIKCLFTADDDEICHNHFNEESANYHYSVSSCRDCVEDDVIKCDRSVNVYVNMCHSHVMSDMNYVGCDMNNIQSSDRCPALNNTKENCCSEELHKSKCHSIQRDMSPQCVLLNRRRKATALCYCAARILLLRSQSLIQSFALEHNKKLVAQVEKKLVKLKTDKLLMEKCNSFLRTALAGACEDVDVDNTAQVLQILHNKEEALRTFNLRYLAEDL